MKNMKSSRPDFRSSSFPGINWGTGIVIAFAGFACFIGFLVFRSIQENIDLVAEDYYAREIHFQDQLNKLSNAQNSDKTFQTTIDNDYLIIHFPAAQHISGSLHFFRPSDASLDWMIEIRADNQGNQKFPLQSFVPGKYVIQADWTEQGKGYYAEKPVFIP